MYESKTFETLLKEKLAIVSDVFDKREGSIIYDSLAPNSIEAAMLYFALDTVLNESFADTASRDYLVKRCAETGISPIEATKAVGYGVFNQEVDLGTRFTCDPYNWSVTEKIGNCKYYLTCETEGDAPNSFTGKLTPIDYVQGLTSAELTHIVIYGEDEEDTEVLRARYLSSFDNKSYGFNKNQYIETVESLQGVGGCKPYRAWNGPGTVKLVITDSNFETPTEALIDYVQTIIDPTQNSGEGEGLAPIDHEVTVFGVTSTTVNISTELTFSSGWDLASCITSIESAVEDYYSELNANWSKEDNIILRVAQLETNILALNGIVDISNTKLNSESGNLELDADSIIKRGTFTNG